MKLCYTVCTNSHLAKAKTMADSLVKHNPDYQVVIGLVDKLGTVINPADFAPHTFVEVEKIQIPDFEEVIRKYTTFEVSCVAKPYFAQYLFEQFSDLERLYYFDADICFFNKLTSVERLLDAHEIVISVHFTTDLEGQQEPNLRNLLNAGLYNTGFLAFKRSVESLRFIQWWGKRLLTEGYHDFAQGMFVDQLWVNFAPLLFKNVLIDTHSGHNVGYWNFHERVVSQKNNQYYINNEQPLVFFHFSGYGPESPDTISQYQERYSFDTRPDVKPIFEEYNRLIISNGHQNYKDLPCAFYKKSYSHQKLRGLRRRIILILRQLLRQLEN
jgi:hypothetical protein